jgi:DNA modification methylase
MAETATLDEGLDIVYRPVETLIPYARNARTHTDEQVAMIAASIREFGFTNPVLVRGDDDGHVTIIAGHARCMAAARLGLAEVPTLDLDYLTEAQARAYVIADNRLAETAGWDLAMLDIEFAELQDAGYELDLTGFDEKARAGIVAELERESEKNKRDDEDDPAMMPVETDIKPGDVIALGDHKLICGDATDKAVVYELLGKEKPGLMITDPPYGVELDANWRGDHQNQPHREIIKNDDRSDWAAAYALFPGDIAYVWHGGLNGDTVARGLHDAGFKVRSQIIWAKNRFAMSRGDYHWQHEPCFYAVRRGATGKFMGGRKQSTIWNIDILQRLELSHPNQKPVECMRRPMLNNSNPGQLIYDPFAGTGTTLVAAELTGRMARLIELDPNFCQMIVDRYRTLFVEDLAATKADDGA